VAGASAGSAFQRDRARAERGTGRGHRSGRDETLAGAQQMAMNLGIDTSGKTEDQLLGEIEMKLSQ
jgi:hypothetical protein